LVEAGVAAVQEAEAVLPPGDLEERLDDAVHQELVAEEAVVLEGVEDQLAVPIERPVLEDERDVELAAREPQGDRIGIRLITRVDVVEHQEEAGEALVDVRPGEIDEMVVVPERRLVLSWVTARADVRPAEVPRGSGREEIQREAVVLGRLKAA